MKTTAFGLTDRGRTREQNEDSFLLDAEAGLYVVCDGLGGHAAGETASRTAVEVASRYVADHASLIEEAGAAEGGRFAVQVLLDEAVKEASRRLHELACTHPEYAGMATTMTLVLFWEGHCTVAHAGDCRLYLLRDGEILRLTADHTMAAELVLRGELEPHEAAASGLANALTRALGSQSSVLVDTLSLDVLEDDTFLLCTDGLHRYFDDAALVERQGIRVRMIDDGGQNPKITHPGDLGIGEAILHSRAEGSGGGDGTEDTGRSELGGGSGGGDMSEWANGSGRVESGEREP